MARLGGARLGKAGQARRGGARRGLARHGGARQARRGRAWRGVARRGAARRGNIFNINKKEITMDLQRKNYVRVKDLKMGDSISFLNEGEWQQKDFSKARDGSETKSVFVLKVNLNGQGPMDYILNAASRESLAANWTYETKSWIGRTAKVNFVKTMSFGKLADILCLLPDKGIKLTSTDPNPTSGDW